MENESNKKVCPRCYFVNEDFAKVCVKCSYPFPRDSIKYIPDKNSNESPNNTEEPSAKKCDNPKAPKKTCPSCGAKVYINRAICPECEHQFEFKSKKKTLPQQETSRKDEINRSPGAPIISYLIYLIPISIWSVVCYFLLPSLSSKIGGWAFVVNFVAFCTSIGLGMFIVWLAEDSYGYRSSGYALFISLFSTIGVLVFSFLQLKAVWTSGYFWDIFFPALNYSCIPLIISAGVITQAIVYYSAIKDHYCIRCRMANLVFLEKTEDGESHVDYKFVTHEAETHTATVTADSKYKGAIGSVTPEHFEADRSTTYTVKYKTPEWQENLGLHKYTKYTNVYKCKRCGYIKKESGTREEKL